MNTEHPRIKREKKTIEAMIHIYCKGHHEKEGKELRQECSQLLDYAKMRLDKCPFQEKKTTCGKCPMLPASKLSGLFIKYAISKNFLRSLYFLDNYLLVEG